MGVDGQAFKEGLNQLLFSCAILMDDAHQLIEDKKVRAFSGHWEADEIGTKDGVKIFRPTKFLSAGLTDKPNLPVQLFNQKESAPMYTQSILIEGTNCKRRPA